MIRSSENRVPKNARLNINARAVIAEIQKSHDFHISNSDAIDDAVSQVQRSTSGSISEILQLADRFDRLAKSNRMDIESLAESKANPFRLFLRPETADAISSFADRYERQKGVRARWPWIVSVFLQAAYVLRGEGSEEIGMREANSILESIAMELTSISREAAQLADRAASLEKMIKGLRE